MIEGDADPGGGAESGLLRLCIGPASWRYGSVPASGDRFLLVDLIGAAVDLNTLRLPLERCVGRPFVVVEVDRGVVARGKLTTAPFTELRSSTELEALLPDAAALMPLYALAATPERTRIFVQLRVGPDDALFLWVADHPGPLDSDDGGRAALTVAGRATEQHRRLLNNHQYYYRQFSAGVEIEHKITLAPETDIYGLAVRLRNVVGTGDFSDYLWEYGDVFQQWDFDNHLFDIPGPPSEAGYVSFIPDSVGTHVMKRKWFTEDAVRRREQKWLGVTATPDGFADHIRASQGADPVYLGSFRRTRFDVSCESARTGNIYALMVDRCVMLAPAGPDLCQLEIEYLHSRTLWDSAVDRLDAELAQLVTASTALLAADHISHTVGPLSKRAYLRALATPVDPGADHGDAV